MGRIGRAAPAVATGARRLLSEPVHGPAAVADHFEGVAETGKRFRPSQKQISTWIQRTRHAFEDVAFGFAGEIDQDVAKKDDIEPTQ